jgi:periplasmic protein CpxP/Spy
MRHYNEGDLTMKRSSKIAVTAAAALVLTAGAAAWAQAPGDGPGKMAGERGWCKMSEKGAGGERGMRGEPGARVDARLASLKEKLEITAEQEPAWEAFEQTVREQTAEMRDGKRHRRPAEAVRTVPERISQMEQRLERMQTVLGAAQDLYAQLSPEQQESADQLLLRRPRM